MVRGRKQSTGRTIRTGWSEADGPLAAPARCEDEPPPEPASEPPPRGPRHLMHRRHGLLTSTVLLLTALLALPWMVERTAGPEDVVRSYLEALVAADGDSLLRYLAAPDGVHDLALSPAIARSTDDRVRAFSLQEVEVRGLEAQVAATLVSGDERRTIRFTLQGTSTGHFEPVRWQLDPVRLPLLDLALPVGTTRLLVNGVEVPIPEVTWRAGLLTPRLLTLRVLPGTYRIALPTAGRPVVAHPVTIRAPLREVAWWSGRVEVEVDLAPSGVSSAIALLHDELAACARSTLPQPVGCPFGVELLGTVRGEWEILTPPQLRYFRAFGGAFDFSGRGLVAAFTEDSGTGSVPGRVHVVRRDIAASVEHEAGRYELAAWRFTRAELPGGWS